jgi:hypothetical protein
MGDHDFYSDFGILSSRTAKWYEGNWSFYFALMATTRHNSRCTRNRPPRGKEGTMIEQANSSKSQPQPTHTCPYWTHFSRPSESGLLVCPKPVVCYRRLRLRACG